MKSKDKKKLTLDNFTVSELKETTKFQGGDGGGETIVPVPKSSACFPPNR